MLTDIIMMPLLAIALQSVTTMTQIDPDRAVQRAHSTGAPADVPASSDDQDPSIDANGKTQVYDQLSAESGLETGFPQLTADRSTGSVNQLSRRDRNMESAPALSERKLGFETATVKLEGSDRCSAELMSAKDRGFCSRVIENRSAEFGGPDPARLSPEQKLLGERDFDLAGKGPEGAARRLATGQNSADGRDDQAIASVVLNRPATEAEQPAQTDNASDIGAETQALIDAIVNTIAGPGGP